MQVHVVASLAVALILAQMGSVEPAESEANGAKDLIALCKGEKLSIRTVSHFKVIAGALETTNPIECNERVRKAMKDMAAIADDSLACTMEKAEALSKFVEDHIKDKPVEEENGRAELPGALVKFAIAYGMRVSNVCKEYMMNDFIDRSLRRMEGKFKGYMWGFINHILLANPLRHILLPIQKTAEVVLPSDLMQLVPGLKIKVDQYLSDRDTLVKMKLICEETLQPIYEPVLLPLARLIRAGLNYRGDFSYPKVNKKIAQFWSITAFMCETVKTIDLSENDKTESELDSEAEACSWPAGTTFDEAGKSLWEIFQERRRSFLWAVERYESGTKLKHVVPRVEVGDKIIGKYEFHLKALVKSFDANKEDADRFREMILSRSLSVFKMMFKKGGKSKAMLQKLLGGFKSNSDEEIGQVRASLLELISAPDGGSALYHTVKTPIYLFKTVAWILTKISIIIAIFVLMFFTCFSDDIQQLWIDLHGHLLD